MLFEIEKHDEKAVVKPSRDVVISIAKKFRDELLNLISEGVTDLTIDLEGVEMIDSDGLTSFIAAHSALNKKGGSFNIINASKDIFAFFRIMNLDKRFHVCMQMTVDQETES